MIVAGGDGVKYLDNGLGLKVFVRVNDVVVVE